MNPITQWFRRRRSRIAGDLEYSARLEEHDGGHRLWVRFPVPRRVIGFDFAAGDGPVPGVERITAETVKGTLVLAFDRRMAGGGKRASVLLYRPVEASGVSVGVGNGEGGFRFYVRVARDMPPDYTLLLHAEALARAGASRRTEAIGEYARYETMTRANPRVAAALSRLHRESGSLDLAEEYALRCLSLGFTGMGFEAFQGLPDEHVMRSPDEIQARRTEAAGWEVGPHFGAVVLDRNVRYRIVREGCYLKSVHETVEIRRTAAARLMRVVGFHIPGSHALLLRTHLRVFRATGEVETVGEGNFSLSDSERRNPFIPMEAEKDGRWILPDLDRGDIVDWTYHLFTREWPDDDVPTMFTISSVFHRWEPTFRGRVEFDADADLTLRFGTLASEFGVLDKEQHGGERRRVVFRGERYIPVRNVAFNYAGSLDPAAACAAGDGGWAAESRRLREVSFGREEFREAVPEPLASLLENGDGDKVAALERAFYWTRDKLKYAALPAALSHIGRDDRGEQIVRAGTGDCKDKSYLLALVCRRLEIPYEFLLVSSKRGVIVEDLPGPQFDHVFVRARGPEGWLYMDPSSPHTVFGSPPPNQQGMKGMVLTEDAPIVFIPPDPPERNRLFIRESVTAMEDGWLRGTFDIEATGNLARDADEMFKGASLSFVDPVQAVQNSLGRFLNYALVEEFERNSDTGSTDVFRMGGRHRRAPLAVLERTRRRAARLGWSVPPLPTWYWRNLSLDRMFGIEYPVRAAIELEVTGALRRDLEETSEASSFSNDLCSIEVTREETEEAVVIRREIVFPERLVTGDKLGQVTPAMEALEQALLVMLSFRPES